MTETSYTLSSAQKRKSPYESAFLVSPERVQQVKEIADTLKHRDKIGKQVVFLLMFEASKDKLLKTAFEQVGLTNGVVARWLSGDAIYDKDIVFDESVRSMRGEVPQRYWRERPAYKHKLQELGLQDFPAFPVTAPPTGRLNDEDRTRIIDAYKHIAEKHIGSKDEVEPKRHLAGGDPVKKQALFLLLLENQPDKDAVKVAKLLGSSTYLGASGKTVHNWKKDPDFSQSFNGLCGLANGIDWRTVPEYRNALHNLGLSDLLDKEARAENTWQARIQRSTGSTAQRFR